ncbi:dirigent protein 22-like [Cornus florida]|uniref:dirigent protein 22-like n=1 Tax=Cornus florida TaxID=4283 RepID=UPI00289ABD8C|nr:dirigent protein 22-like [Cornus florida]
MRKLSIDLMLCLAVMVMPMVYGIAQEPKAVEEWFQKLSLKKEKVTKLHFYFHDIVSGKNPTATRVAQSNFTDKSPTFFGMVVMMDDPLTAGPEPTSKIIGRAQGIYASAGLKELGLLMTLNFHFTDGKYNGSTLAVLGRNPALNLYREMSVVGGSGAFRLARGIATAKTYWVNTTTADAIVEYNVIVLHY